MLQRLIACVGIIGLVVTANAQTTVNLRGKVANKNGKAVSGAIVTLVKQGLKDTTDADGAYTISTATALKMPLLVPENESIILNNGGLAFSLSQASAVTIQIFDINGILLKKDFLPNISTGFYRFSVSENTRTSKLLIIKASVGQTEMTFRYIPLSNGKSTVNASVENSGMPVNVRLAKLMAINDTLKITAAGYAEKTVAIVSYDQQLDITIDSAAGGSTGSAGCGKALGSFNKTGNNTMISSGKNRIYRIDIPSDYDKDKPYRLIFGMHCMGGSADKVAGTTDQSKNYYGLKTQAQKDNIQCIYVAPLGNGDGTWQGEPDRTFFFDLQKLLKDSLCVDTTRVFSVGFSFGAMFTYALSLKYPEILRAVACNAPANFVMDQPPNRHVPLAYVQTTGTQDGTCPWERGSVGGKYCLLQHGEDNGCTTTGSDIKLATNGTHVVNEFKGCQEGYPVKFLSHNGGHECNKTDQGSNVDWIPVEFWNFFKQF